MSRHVQITRMSVAAPIQCREIPAAAQWLTPAFGTEPRWITSGAGNSRAHAQLVFGNVMVSSAFVVFMMASHLSGADRIDFARDVRPILSDYCYQCHGPDAENRKGDLRLDQRATIFGQRDGGPLISPGDVNESLLWQRMASTDDNNRMPPPSSVKVPTAQQLAAIKRWIEQGAEWNEHWAFQPYQRPKATDVIVSDRVANDIDRFLLARLADEGRSFSPIADRRTLARRLSFDLTGLPPEPEDVEAFVADTSDNAWEAFVDCSFASPHYGERMAVAWLDAARYGDTSVFHADGSRDMWPWRDWVINAYNSNKSFRDFTIEQLAGDLLPNATSDQVIASGFNRNNATTDEGGAIAEEFRVEYAVDRVRTTSMVWMGISLECCQCHDHKYDPFTMKDYYQVFAYFNQAADPGMQKRSGNQAPVVDVFDDKRLTRAEELKSEVPAFTQALDARAAAAGADFITWITKAAANPSQAGIDPRPRDAILHVPLDETKGRMVHDLVTKDQTGRVLGKPLWTKGRINGAFRFDRTNHIDFGDAANFDRLDPFSFGCWMKPEGDASGVTVGRLSEAENNRGFAIDSSGGRLQLMIANEWPLNSIMVTTDKVLAADTWQHVFVTYDGSSRAAGVTIYVDGKGVAGAAVADCLTRTIRNNEPLLVGRRYTGRHGSPFLGLIDDVRIYNRELSESEVQSLAGQDPITPLLRTHNRTPEQTQKLRDYYLRHHDAEYRRLASHERDRREQISRLSRAVTTVMVMKDVPKPRETFILTRGAYDQPSDVPVNPTPLTAIAPVSNDAPANRLGLAQWLFRDDHPLTARVAVNRHWRMLFGTGLVETLEDFGSQGEYPSHPQLLDWLAADFRDNGWNVKRLLKQIVMSTAYRQSSSVSPELLQRDPNNRLLGRGPRFRLHGEFIRDAALAVSGLLVRDFGGPGVKPYQPPGLWAEVGLGGNPKFVMDHGNALYRRSIYTFWKRSAPPPDMQLFDAPTRERCTLRRSRTNTPLQALVVMNNVQFVEAARHLAQRVLVTGARSDDKRFELLYQRVLCRSPRESERTVIKRLLKIARTRFRADPEQATRLLEFGERKRDESLDATEHAAWTVVASTVLNLDETLTRN